MTATGVPGVPGRVLVIGVGNADRGDDAAGLLVARRVREACPPGVEVLEWSGELSGLLDRWTPADRVIVVDASRVGIVPGAVHRLAGAAGRLPAGPPAGGSHDLDLAAVLRLAEALGRAPCSVVVVGVEGADFSPGAHVSAAVAVAVDVAATLVLEELAGLGAGAASGTG